MGKLYIVATPIGNLEDITLRALRVLGELDALACEDTRRTRILYEKHGIRSPRTIFSYRESNEQQGALRILGLLAEGLTVGVCSDAGYPGISDAGYRVINLALAEGIPVEVIPEPGPSSLPFSPPGSRPPASPSRGFHPASRASESASWPLRRTSRTRWSSMSRRFGCILC